MSAVDILLVAAVLIAVGLAVRSRLRARKQGKSCCGDGCGRCEKCGK